MLFKFFFKRMLIYESLWHFYYLYTLFHSLTYGILSNFVIFITYLHKEIVEKLKNMTHCFNLWTFRTWILKSHELDELPHNLKSQLRHLFYHHLKSNSHKISSVIEIFWSFEAYCRATSILFTCAFERSCERESGSQV